MAAWEDAKTSQGSSINSQSTIFIQTCLFHFCFFSFSLFSVSSSFGRIFFQPANAVFRAECHAKVSVAPHSHIFWKKHENFSRGWVSRWIESFDIWGRRWFFGWTVFIMTSLCFCCWDWYEVYNWIIQYCACYFSMNGILWWLLDKQSSAWCKSYMLLTSSYLSLHFIIRSYVCLLFNN